MMVYCPIEDSFCKCLQSLSAMNWDMLEDAVKYRSPIHEETITQITSLHLNKPPFHLINKVEQLTKTQEKKLGADWLWIFYEREYWRSFKVIVQAKRLYDCGTYRAITEQQTTKLINYARHKNAIPIYLFYNHKEIINRASQSPAGKRKIAPLLQSPQRCKECIGSMVTHASNIHILTAKKARKPENTFPVCYPWWKPTCRCFLGSSGSPGSDRINSLVRGFQSFRMEDEKTPYIREPLSLDGTIKKWVMGEEVRQEELRKILRPDIDERQPLAKPSFVIATDVTALDEKLP